MMTKFKTTQNNYWTCQTNKQNHINFKSQAGPRDALHKIERHFCLHKMQFPLPPSAAYWSIFLTVPNPWGWLLVFLRGRECCVEDCSAEEVVGKPYSMRVLWVSALVRFMLHSLFQQHVVPSPGCWLALGQNCPGHPIVLSATASRSIGPLLLVFGGS